MDGILNLDECKTDLEVSGIRVILFTGFFTAVKYYPIAIMIGVLGTILWIRMWKQARRIEVELALLALDKLQGGNQ